MKPEKALEGQLIAALRANGWFARHFDAPGLDGWPDILAVKGPFFRLFECKANTLKLRPSQSALAMKLFHENAVKVLVVSWWPGHPKGDYLLTTQVNDEVVAGFRSCDDLVTFLERIG